MRVCVFVFCFVLISVSEFREDELKKVTIYLRIKKRRKEDLNFGYIWQWVSLEELRDLIRAL